MLNRGLTVSLWWHNVLNSEPLITVGRIQPSASAQHQLLELEAANFPDRKMLVPDGAFRAPSHNQQVH